MSCSPSKAAFQAFCIDQHYSSGRSKETWARLLQGRTEWWKTIIWQHCISSIWNDSKLLLSLGTHRELGQATTTTWQFLNTSCAPRRPLDVSSQIYGHVSEPQSGEVSMQRGKSGKPVYLSCASLKSIDMWPMHQGHSAKCSLWLYQKNVLKLFCWFKAKFCNLLKHLRCTNPCTEKSEQFRRLSLRVGAERNLNAF